MCYNEISVTHGEMADMKEDMSMKGFRMATFMALDPSSSPEQIFRVFGPTPTQKFQDAQYVALLDKETKSPFFCHRQELRRQGKTQRRIIVPNMMPPLQALPIEPVMATA